MTDKINQSLSRAARPAVCRIRPGPGQELACGRGERRAWKSGRRGEQGPREMMSAYAFASIDHISMA
jgi:hypothetical protein